MALDIAFGNILCYAGCLKKCPLLKGWGPDSLMQFLALNLVPRSLVHLVGVFSSWFHSGSFILECSRI
jgi:hypothetical protein